MTTYYALGSDSKTSQARNAVCRFLDLARCFDPVHAGLVQSEKFVESHGGKPGDFSIYGQESNSTTRHLATMNLAKDSHPKPLIETIAEDLLATFKTAPLLDAYDVDQHLRDYWAMTMQDDCYIIADAVLTAPLFKSQIDLMITGGDQPNFGPYHLARISFPAPPSPRTTRHPDGVERCGWALLGGLDRLIVKKRDLKQAMMQKLLTGRTRLV